MIKGEKKQEKEKLTAKAILDKVDDYNIIRYYLGQDFDFKKKFASPFRKDTNPNLGFFMGSSGKIMFKDFASGAGGDCMAFVMKLHGINFNEALIKIDEDFGLGIYSPPKFKIQLIERPDSIHKQAKLIQIIPRGRFTEEELDYWKQFEITVEELERKGVLPIQKLFLNKKQIANPNKELRFAYVFDEYIKIYSPLSKEYKWISSCPNDFISGFDEIKYKVYRGNQDQKLIISKSVKDELVLKKFFKDVCSTQNESKEAISPEDMQWIIRGYHPKDVYMAYDSDEAGVKNSTYYTQGYGFSHFNVPKVFLNEGIKDWADLVKHKGLDTMENYLKIKKLI